MCLNINLRKFDAEEIVYIKQALCQPHRTQIISHCSNSSQDPWLIGFVSETQFQNTA